MSDDANKPDKVDESTRITEAFAVERSQPSSSAVSQRVVSTADGSHGQSVADRLAQTPEELPSFGSVYETLGMLGRGGMSVVYKVRHKLIGKIAAVKVLQVHLLRDPNQARRFEAEAKALFALEHPNIVSVRAFEITPDGTPYLVMDYLEGRAINDELKRLKTIPVPRALKLFIQACDALQHAHNKGIVHRDIKPSNMVLTADENGNEVLKLVDFGIAKLNQDATGETIAALTATGDVFGSPPYMSPEQCYGHALGPLSDMYSFGCVMYEMLSGDTPFQADSAMAVIHKHTSKIAEPLQIPGCDPRLTSRLDEIIFRTLEKDPKKRYQSMDALKKDLEEVSDSTGWTKHTGVYLKYTRNQRRMVERVKQHPMIFLSSAFAAVLIVGLLVTGMLAFQSSTALLQAEPQIQFDAFDWHFDERKIVETPEDFEFKVSLARGVIERKQLSGGKASVDVILARNKLAKYYMKYGHWNDAIGLLDENWSAYSDNDSYDTSDIRRAPILANLAFCFLARGSGGDLQTAIKFYRDANRIYGSNATLDDREYQLLNVLRLGIAQLEVSKFLPPRGAMGACAAAELTFRSETWKTPDQLCMAKSGVGDSFLLRARILGAAKNKYFVPFLDKARTEYQQLGDPKEPGSRASLGDFYDAAVADIRLADSYIMQHDYVNALAQYDILEKSGWIKELSAAQVEKYELTRARLLWRNSKWLEAVKAMPKEPAGKRHSKSST